MVHSPYDNGPADEPAESRPLPFEAEFDGVRRPVAPPAEPLFDPDRYWRLNSGTD